MLPLCVATPKTLEFALPPGHPDAAAAEAQQPSTDDAASARRGGRITRGCLHSTGLGLVFPNQQELSENSEPPFLQLVHRLYQFALLQKRFFLLSN